MEKQEAEANIFLSTEELEKLRGWNLKEVQEHFADLLKEIDSTIVRVAVTGLAGAGKSHFINTIRGLRNRMQDPDLWSPTGVKETTLEKKDYPHPLYENIIFTDLPGFGGMKEEFKQENYLKTIDFSVYDFVLLVTKDRFLQSDAWLLRHLHSISVPAFLVRTHIDKNIETNLETEGIGEDATLLDIRQDIQKRNDELKIGGVRVYLISSRYQFLEKWDFPDLNKAILESLHGWKKQNFLKSLPVYAVEWVNLKCKALEARIFYYAAASGTTALVPVPGLSITADTSLLVAFAMDCRNTFGLTKEALENLVAAQRIAEGLMGRITVLAAALCSVEGALKILTAYVASNVVEETLRFVPIIGSLLAGTISTVTTYYGCQSILQEFRELAEQVAQELAQGVQEDAEKKNK